MASKKEFIATDRNAEEIAASLGADYVLYLDREEMNEAAKEGNENIDVFCNACFNGDYPTEDVTLEQLKAIEDERGCRRDNVTV